MLKKQRNSALSLHISSIIHESLTKFPFVQRKVIFYPYIFVFLIFLHLIEALGFHRDKINEMIEDWSKLQKLGRHEPGLNILNSLRERSTPFYFAQDDFNYPGMSIYNFTLIHGLDTILRPSIQVNITFWERSTH